MPDLRLQQTITDDLQAIKLDLLLTPAGQIDEADALRNAVIVALGTDARAADDDVLPDPDSDDRRGWWGDTGAAEIWNGWPVGSKIWLLSRTKITGSAAKQGSTLALAEFYVFEALRPLIARRIASRVEVTAERKGLGRIEVAVTIFRGPSSDIDLRYQILWNEITA